jgi:hypothetical protein
MALGTPFAQAVAGKPPIFAHILIPHIVAGAISLLSGALVLLSRRGTRWRARVEVLYAWAVAGLVATAAGLTAVRGLRDLRVFLLGVLSLALAAVGPFAGRHPAGRARPGAGGLAMPASYAVLWSAFLVDNGRFLPLVGRLPRPARAALPAAVATPLIVWSLLRRPSPGRTPADLGRAE